jgi:hypothetical protein
VHANRGDRIIVESTHVGQPRRQGEVVEVVSGDGGHEHYRVRWDDDHESLYFPSSGCRVVATGGLARTGRSGLERFAGRTPGWLPARAEADWAGGASRRTASQCMGHDPRCGPCRAAFGPSVGDVTRTDRHS